MSGTISAAAHVAQLVYNWTFERLTSDHDDDDDYAGDDDDHHDDDDHNS